MELRTVFTNRLITRDLFVQWLPRVRFGSEAFKMCLTIGQGQAFDRRA